MMTLLLVSLFAHAQSTEATLVTSQKIVVTSASVERVCGYLANDAKKTPVCSPDDLDAPKKNQHIAITDGMTCTWTTAPGLSCNGELNFYALFLQMPTEGQILSVALPPRTESNMDACAIRKMPDGTQNVVCWGGNTAVEQLPADLKAPSVVATNGTDACSNSDDTYVRCWGQSSLGNSPYGARNLKKLVMSKDTVCGIDDFGLMCWGLAVQVPEELARDGVVKDVAAIDGETCALTFEHQVQCWGSSAQPVPELHSPIALSSFDGAICATDQDGVKCWGPTVSNPYRDRVQPIGRYYPGREIDPF